MVHYTKHEYEVESDLVWVWKLLLNRYYEGSKIWASECGAKKISLKTERIWSEGAMVCALPNLPFPSKDTVVAIKDKDLKAFHQSIELISKLIERRSELDGAERLLSKDIDLSFCKMTDVLPCLTCPRSDITRWSYSPSLNQLVLVLANRHPILITSQRVSDIRLPSLDFEDLLDQYETKCGTNPIVFPEWTEELRQWKGAFDANPEMNWNKPIILS